MIRSHFSHLVKLDYLFFFYFSFMCSSLFFHTLFTFLFLTMKPTEQAEVQITSNNTTPANFKNIQSKGVEIYTGGGEWKAVENVSTDKNAVVVKLPANASVPVYNNQILFRTKGQVNKLTDYDLTIYLMNKNKV